MELKEKQIYIIDAVLIVGTLVAVFLIVGYARPLVLAPLNDFETTNASVLFSFEKGSAILIDDNPEFTSPEKIYAENNLVINLKPGTYYWKVEGIINGEVRNLTVKSEVDLKLRDEGERYSVVNSGNTRLKVDIYDNSTLVGNVILDVDNSANVSGTKFVGEQNE